MSGSGHAGGTGIGSAVSPKLLVLLGLSMVVAAFGVWNLVTAEDVVTESGFEPNSDLPMLDETFAPSDDNGLVQPSEPEVEPISEFAPTSSRNPFQRVDPNAALGTTPAEQPPAADAPSAVDAESAPIPEPVFPNPDLVTADDPGSDTSFEG